MSDHLLLPPCERESRWVGTFSLQEPLQFFDAHANVGENPAECSFGDIATVVYRDRRAASVRVPHDAVAAPDPGHLETRFSLMPGRPVRRAEMGRVASGHVNHEREFLRRAKLGDQPSAASRKSATAASRVSPSPLAPTPGRS